MAGEVGKTGPGGGRGAGAAPMRRAPRQERGARRVAAILDAAEAVLAEVGYEATTTNAIAARAGASVGSLYQFFPNKEAVARALTERYLGELRALFDRVFAPAAYALPLPALLDGVVDPLAEFYAAHAGFQSLLEASGVPECVSSPKKDIDGEVIARVEAMLAVRAPGLDEDKRHLYATVGTHIVDALLPLTVPAGGDVGPRPEVVTEIKRALGAYIERALGPGGRA